MAHDAATARAAHAKHQRAFVKRRRAAKKCWCGALAAVRPEDGKVMAQCNEHLDADAARKASKREKPGE